MSDIIGLMCFITLLILINAFYVIAEFALISVDEAELKEKQEKHPWAKHMYQNRSDAVKQDHYIAVAQLGVTAASLGLGVYSEHALANILQRLLDNSGWQISGSWVHWIATFAALSLLTYVHVVFGEMIPKGMALHKPLTMAKFVEVPMHISGIILAPCVWILNELAYLFLAIFNIPRKQNLVTDYTAEIISLAFQDSAKQGIIKEERNDLCQHLLDLEEKTVSQVMVARVKVVGLKSDMTVKDAVKEVVKKEGYSRYPVYEEDMDHIVGFVHVRDMYKMLLDNKGDTLISSPDLLRPCQRIPVTRHLDDALRDMRAQQDHIAAIVAEHGGIEGIVTMEDVLEEVFGEVFDEFDEDEVEPIVKDPLKKNSWKVAGSVSLENLSEAVDRTLEHENIDTVSGLLMDLLGKLPQKGEKAKFQGLEFEVLEVDDMVPSLCSVTLLPDEEDKEQKAQEQ